MSGSCRGESRDLPCGAIWRPSRDGGQSRGELMSDKSNEPKRESFRRYWRRVGMYLYQGRPRRDRRRLALEHWRREKHPRPLDMWSVVSPSAVC